MIKILVVSDDPNVREVYRLFFETEFDSFLLEAGAAASAIHYLEQITDIDVVICDYLIKGGNGDQVYEYVLKHRPKTRFILSSETDARNFKIFRSRPPFGQLFRPHLLRGLKELLQTVAHRKSVSEYIRIRLDVLLDQGQARCDLYSKTTLEGDQFRWVKVFRAGDRFELTDYERFQQKGIEFLFAKATEIQPWIEHLTQQAQKKAEQQVSLLRDSLPWSLGALEFISEANRELGMGVETQTLTYQVMAAVVREVAENQNLESLSRALKLNTDRYLASHSLMLAYLSCAMCIASNSDSRSELAELALASLLHDLPLQNDDLAKVHSETELEHSRPPFSAEEKQRWKNHIHDAAGLSTFFPTVSENVRDIILRHHDVPKPSAPSEPSSTRDTSAALPEIFQLAEKRVHDLARSMSGDQLLLDWIKNIEEPYATLEPYRSILRTLSLACAQSNENARRS